MRSMGLCRLYELHGLGFSATLTAAQDSCKCKISAQAQAQTEAQMMRIQHRPTPPGLVWLWGVWGNVWVWCLPSSNKSRSSQSNSCNALASNQQIQSKLGTSCKTLNCKLNEKEELIKEQRDNTWDTAHFGGNIQFKCHTVCESSSDLKSYCQRKDSFVN